MSYLAGPFVALKRRAPLRSAGARLRSALSRLQELLVDQRGSQVTDNLGLIVIGIVAIVAIGTLITNLDSTIFKWLQGELGLS
ncbi:MAG TPA: hypothetical protein VL984_02570 [Acidimicrobiales bacterium]|nr:hypothetical protein [Acidimicrobiales bacterium]